MKLTKQQLKEMIREELITEDVLARNVADSFTRYLMGDSKKAIQELISYTNPRIGYGHSEPGSREYNKEYAELYNSFLKILRSGF